jgi:hypothetical protein
MEVNDWMVGAEGNNKPKGSLKRKTFFVLGTRNNLSYLGHGQVMFSYRTVVCRNVLSELIFLSRVTSECAQAYALDADEIQLNLCITVIACPKIEWCCVNLIDKRNGITETS